MSIKDSLEETREFAKRVIVEMFEKDRMTVDEFDQTCVQIESADSITDITKLIEHIPSEIIEYMKDRTTDQDHQEIHGKFSKQKRTGTWLRSKQLLVSWSFGRISLDLIDAIKSLPSGGAINIDLKLNNAKCRIAVPDTVGVVDKIDMFNQSSFRCSKSILNRAHNSVWTVVFHGRLSSSKVRVVSKGRLIPRMRRIVQRYQPKSSYSH